MSPFKGHLHVVQAAAVKTSREALQLCAQQQETGGAPFDIILKEHSPPTVNACRFLRRVLADEALKHTPVIGEPVLPVWASGG